MKMNNNMWLNRDIAFTGITGNLPTDICNTSFYYMFVVPLDFLDRTWTLMNWRDLFWTETWQIQTWHFQKHQTARAAHWHVSVSRTRTTTQWHLWQPLSQQHAVLCLFLEAWLCFGTSMQESHQHNRSSVATSKRTPPRPLLTPNHNIFWNTLNHNEETESKHLPHAHWTRDK